jgi:hypothetical protein
MKTGMGKTGSLATTDMPGKVFSYFLLHFLHQIVIILL